MNKKCFSWDEIAGFPRIGVGALSLLQKLVRIDQIL